MWRAAVCAVVIGLAAAPAQACRLALLLALDVSRSIDAGDYRIQRDGLLDALADPAIRAALLRPGAPVALAIYEWSGTEHQEVIVDWSVIATGADLAAVEAVVAARTVPPQRRATALGAALAFGRAMIDRAPRCAETVLDVSGDGRNNMGPPPATAYEGSDWGGIRVNGLAIGEHERDLVAYYGAEVIRGPGAFVEDAPRQRDFPRAIRRKLLRELTEMMMGQAGPGPSRLR
ncbi:MAG: DUF1194 domain-containing protein [Gemmobacter sp.]